MLVTPCHITITVMEAVETLPLSWLPFIDRQIPPPPRINTELFTQIKEKYLQ